MKLKGCPWCEDEPVIVNTWHRLSRPSRNGKYHIECYNCELMFGYDDDYGGQFKTKKEATEKWNSRIK